MDSLRDKRLKNATKGSALSVAIFAIALAASGQALAQTSSYQSATDNVVINWDALDGRTQPAPMRGKTYGTIQQNIGMPATSGGLLMPGPSVPGSQLYVAPPSGGNVQLHQPAPAAAPMIAKTTPAAPPPAKMPAAAPAPVVAKAPPPSEPAPSAPKQLTETKAPAPANVAAPSAAPAAPPAPPAPQIAAAPATPAKAETKAADAAPPAPAAQEQASTPPADGPVQILFNGDDTKLTADAQAALAQALIVLSRSEKTRVQLMAYAFGGDLTSSKARRISLSRALSVRSYLIEKGVRSTRIDVRALGDKAEDEPKNRVDVNFVER